MRHYASVLTVAALSTLVLAASSASAVDAQVGEDATPTAPCVDGFTIFQTVSAGSSYAVKADGVITSWRTRGGAAASSTRTFKLGRLDGTSLSVVASGTPLAVPAGQLVGQPVRIPGKAGDVLGFFHTGGGDASQCATITDNTYGFVNYLADVPVGPAPSASLNPGAKFSVMATVEPDADHDGYGDTTQDLCSTQAATQGACRDTAAPRTRIISAKAATLSGRATKAKVIVTFKANEAATFACSVDKAAYKRCTSPLVRKLGQGKHTIGVRAVDAAGNKDTTPAKATVRVKSR